MDEQHRTLFADANALVAASQRNAPDTLSRFDELISHVLGHFADEERLLREIGYEGHDAHRRAHMRLADQALQLRHAMIGGHHQHEELLRFLLEDVIQRHMLVDDQRFYAALREAQQKGRG